MKRIWYFIYLTFKHDNYLRFISIPGKLTKLNLHVITSANAELRKFISNVVFCVIRFMRDYTVK